jgi:tetratricopeptide (TPR) repeat protein
MPVEVQLERARRGSKRIRRVTWTASAIAVLLAICGLVTWRIHKENQPDEYVPGEESKDITNVVASRSAQKTASVPQPVKKDARSHTVDRLLDPGKKLPAGAPEPLFTDVTKAAGLDSFRQFQGARTSQLPEDMGSGVAWGDFDNDGLEDLFVVSGGGPLNGRASQLAPSVLYRNLGDGHFEKVEDFPDLRIHGMAAAWGDYNNDGWLDLVVTGYATIILFRNDHGHLVQDKTFPSPKGLWAGASWGDFNRDGYLDLYVCGYVKYRPNTNKDNTTSTQFGMEVPFTLNPASYEPERNLLFRNNGNGTFTEVAKDLGVANPDGRSLVALWHDFNGDGWPDLYVANDISENKLYINQHGKFVDAGKDAWVEEYRGSMGLAAGDFDRDGDDDLFISHWIAQGFALYQSLSNEQKEPGKKSELHFTDVAATTGIGEPSMRKVGWGTSFVDIDSDGWPDLLVANGSTFEDKESSPRRLSPMPSFLFWNAQGDFFHDLAPWNRNFSQPHVSRGLAVADYNSDGAMDVAIVDQGEGVRLLRNDIPQGNWVELRLHDRVPPTNAPLGFGDGATVIAWVKGVPLRRSIGSSSYLSQDSHRIHIGLGTATQIDRLEVHWLRGPAETLTNLAANQIWDLTQGEPEAKAFNPQAATAKVPSKAAIQTEPAGLVQFWAKEHAAMDAMKREQNFPKAAQLFREALAINPNHEDSHYYLANCLAAQGDVPSAVAELDSLIHINPQNHRAFQRKGELLAASATSRSQLSAARQALDAGLRLNSEETGTLTLMGEVALAHGDIDGADRDFAHVRQANPRSANAWFFSGYIAWKKGDNRNASTMLTNARNALGPDWKPSGSVLEGDVQHRMYSESGFLGLFEQQWDGSPNPTMAYARLDTYLRRLR